MLDTHIESTHIHKYAHIGRGYQAEMHTTIISKRKCVNNANNIETNQLHGHSAPALDMVKPGLARLPPQNHYLCRSLQLQHNHNNNNGNGNKQAASTTTTTS